MTRAKPKPSIPTREPARKSHQEKPAPVKAAPVKAGKAVAPLKPATSAKAAPAKATAPKAVATKAAPTKAPPPKPAALTEAVPSKAAAGKPAVPAKTSATAKEAPPAKTVKPSASKATPAKPSARLDTPAKLRPIEQAVGVSSDAVARRTGKSWAEWFALLDAAGAAELDHKGIVAVLAQRHGVGPWWQQMVTVAYEQARGKNGNTATDDGFQVDVSKVLELPLAKLFRFWAEPAERNKWLADDRFSIHKATASKSIRARWGRGVSRIDVDFCEKGPSKSQVTVQHNRIETSDAAEQMKAYWAKKIRALEALTRA